MELTDCFYYDPTGVSLRQHTVDGVAYERWVAQWYELGSKQPKSKSFGILKYGNERAFQLACEYRAKVIKRLNAQGANYTERHGQ